MQYLCKRGVYTFRCLKQILYMCRVRVSSAPCSFRPCTHAKYFALSFDCVTYKYDKKKNLRDHISLYIQKIIHQYFNVLINVSHPYLRCSHKVDNLYQIFLRFLRFMHSAVKHRNTSLDKGVTFYVELHLKVMVIYRMEQIM